MSVVREGVIRIRTEHIKGKLEAPDTSEAARAYTEVAKGASEARDATAKYTAETSKVAPAALDAARGVKESAAATAEAVKAQREAAVNAEQSSKSFAEMAKGADEIRRGLTGAGTGALQLAKGLAFIGASSEKDLAALARGIAQIEGTFNVFRGGAKLVSGLTASFGPAGTALGALTVALGAGALAWRKYANAAEEAAKAQEAARRQAEGNERELGRLEQRLGGEEIGIALTPEERERRASAERERLRGELERLDRDLGRESADLTRTPEDFAAAARRTVAGQRGRGGRGSTEAEARPIAEQMARDFQPLAAEIQDVIEVERRRAEVSRRIAELEQERLAQQQGGQDALGQAQKTLDAMFRLMAEAERKVVELEHFKRQIEGAAP